MGLKSSLPAENKSEYIAAENVIAKRDTAHGCSLFQKTDNERLRRFKGGQNPGRKYHWHCRTERKKKIENRCYK